MPTANRRLAGSQPVVRSDRGAVSAAHPAAAAAGAAVLERGGTAVDATIAAQAVVCVLCPDAASLGGDLLALVRTADGVVTAVNGTGASSATRSEPGRAPGATVTTPGLVGGWSALRERFGRLAVADVLNAAVLAAEVGIVMEEDLLDAVDTHRGRLVAGGAEDWSLLGLSAGGEWRQPELARLLQALGRDGLESFYSGPPAVAIAAAVARHGGALDLGDLAAHRTVVAPPLSVAWDGGRVHVQPPLSQGVLLAMALRHLERPDHPGSVADAGTEDLDHVLVELTEAAFAHRSDCGRGPALLDLELEVDRDRAAHRGGPRAYLHTAGVAAVDAEGTVVSSLISVFDDFGSGVFVPELGITLNNRAEGFTEGANAYAPGRRPVHTLAPCLLENHSQVIALATPGADGQIQTLLQILTALRYRGSSLEAAVAAPRWRTEGGTLLVESGHPATTALRRRGHDVAERAAGDPVFGGVVVAGTDANGPFSLSDWRRRVSSAAAGRTSPTTTES